MPKKSENKHQQDYSPSIERMNDTPWIEDINLSKSDAKYLDNKLGQQEVMIRGIVHDVNNNLMAIMAACDQIESRHIKPIDVEIITSSIRNHISSATTLMRELLNHQNMDTSVLMNQDELSAFISSLLPGLALVAGDDTVIELGAVVTPPVFINPELIHRVLLQLVRNVSELNVEYPLAYISIRKVGDWCELSVSDNGDGLGDLTADTVFLPGVTSKDKSGARGYGLSAVAWAVDSWNGEYGVEAIEGDKGARFWVRLPLKSEK